MKNSKSPIFEVLIRTCAVFLVVGKREDGDSIRFWSQQISSTENSLKAMTRQCSKLSSQNGFSACEDQMLKDIYAQLKNDSSENIKQIVKEIRRRM